MRRRFWIYGLPLVLLAAVTVPHLGQGDFRTDTARYAAVGVQAWREPGLFPALRLQPGVPYFNKPPLVFWIHGGVLHGFGPGVAAARAPSILAAAGVVLLVVALARRWWGSGVALLSGCVLALTYEFFRRTREISLDLWQLTFMMAGVALYGKAAALRRRRWALAAGLAFGLALLCKPFMALLAVLLVIPVCRRVGMVAALLAGVVLAAAPWHAAMVLAHGDAFMAHYLGREVVSRVQGAIHTEPWWYYAAEMGRSYWPWWPALAAGIWLAFRDRVTERRRRAWAGVLAWVGVWAVALSCFPDKRPRYALPLYPGMAMLAGYGLARLPWRGGRRWYRRGLPLTAAVVVVLATLVAVLPVRVQAPPDRDLTALMKWCAERPGVTFHSAALSTNDEGYFYLKQGRWPLRLPQDGRGSLPPGALLIYTDGFKPKPGRREVEVFRSGPYRVTRRGN